MMRDISLHIMDILQNSIKAGANCIETILEINNEKGLLYVTIKDNGCGMDEEFLKKVQDPFTTSRTTRKVGLGVPMFKQSGEICGGEFSIWSKPGEGTVISAGYGISHIDRLPLGDIGDTIAMTIGSYPDIKYILLLKGGNEDFDFNTDDVKNQLGDVPISEFAIVQWLREYINEGITQAFKGILSEII